MVRKVGKEVWVSCKGLTVRYITGTVAASSNDQFSGICHKNNFDADITVDIAPAGYMPMYLLPSLSRPENSHPIRHSCELKKCN